MKLYEIVEALDTYEYVDKETGEVNEEYLNELTMEFDQKIENLALIIKNNRADIKALKDEEDSFKKRRQQLERTTEGLGAYLTNILKGEKKTYPKAAISFRTSYAVGFPLGEEDFIKWAKENAPSCIMTKEELSKSRIKELLDDGAEMKFAEIVSKTNIQIK